ncbi:DUF1990 family protein [Paludisphaera rhizosphaerae]|uniref:DUF1990 family protein n=1 Tax=Paludisphaera rhizosphaerae TaxID=2711216 RepID=UPI0013EC6B11|nr:DUF1990 domain-containing protein [Paludisphaera rhizosphaerae]
MRSFSKPSAETVQKFLEGQANLDFTYNPVGATADPAPPADYGLNHTRQQIGTGREAFERAREALRRWDQFRIGWAEIQPEHAPIREGEVVAIVAHRLGFWWLNACRVVYVIDEDAPGADFARFGFAYGTLPDHVGSGEERFLVDWDAETDAVWYDIEAYSRPHLILTRLGYPYMRWSQRAFGRESAAAMLRSMNDQTGVEAS